MLQQSREWGGVKSSRKDIILLLQHAALGTGPCMFRTLATKPVPLVAINGLLVVAVLHVGCRHRLHCQSNLRGVITYGTFGV